MKKHKQFIYRTTCLECGWHLEKGAPFSAVHEHLRSCTTGTIVISVKLNTSKSVSVGFAVGEVER